MGRSVFGSLVRLLEHGCDAFVWRPFALASRRGYPDIMLLQRQRWGIDQVKVQKDAARLQVRADITVDLADALEITQVVQTASGHCSVKGTELLRQPVFVEEVSLVGLKARAVTGHDLPRLLQHRLGTILGNTSGVGELVEDELTHWPVTGADIQDRDCGVCRKREQVAQELEPLGSRRVCSPLPRDPLFDIRVRCPIMMIAPLHGVLQRLKSTQTQPFYGSIMNAQGCPRVRAIVQVPRSPVPVA